MSKKKIAFYIESMVVGGAEKVLIDLVNNLNPNLFEITVIAVFKNSVYSDYEYQFSNGFSSNIKYKWLIDNSNSIKYKAFNLFYNKLNKGLIHRILVKEKFDIEIAFYEGLPTEFVSHSQQKSKKIAWLHTNQKRLYENLNKNLFILKSNIYEKFSEVYGVSNSVVESFKEYFPNNKVFTLYNPLDDKKISEKSLTSKVDILTPYWVTVGRLIPIKGYERLIHVCAKLKDEGYQFKLIMIGDGYLKVKIMELILKFRLEDFIVLKGNLENPYPYIKNAEMLICSSFQEGLSTVVLESLILNTPIVTTNCSGMDELIDSGVTGMIVENSDKGLYEGLKKLLNRKEIISNYKTNITNYKTKLDLHNTIISIEKRILC